MPYGSTYSTLVGRGEVEASVLATLYAWIVPYVAEVERQRGLPPRSTVIPPTPESIHGGVDFETFGGELMPEIIAVVMPIGETERMDPGVYGQWFNVAIAALVQVEGDQDRTRQLADLYGTALEGIVAQQGAFGYHLPDGRFTASREPDATPFATRTRLYSAPVLRFPDETVRTIMMATVTGRTFVATLVDDLAGPRVVPTDPYASPAPWALADQVHVDLLRDPDAVGITTADAVVEDATVNPPVERFTTERVDIPTSP